jgi:flagellum-specific peptidoglycan hydrolase FlgJ
MIQFIKNHWFKTTFILLLSYVALRKELSFHFNINNKATKEPKETPRTKYTDEKANSIADELSIFDLFEPSKENTLTATFEAISEQDKISFVKRFGKVAREEQARFGIPTSLILASALVQSHVGKRALALEGNNYFGLRCLKNSTQKSQYEDDRAYRVYPSAWESFRDNSLFLQSQIGLKKGNYKQWIAKIGTIFKTGEEYTALLTRVIEHYELYKLD